MPDKNTTDEWLWTDWHGEECPVPDGVKFMVRFDDGEVIGPCMNMPKEEWINAPCIAAYAILNPDYVAPGHAEHLALLKQCGEALVKAAYYIPYEPCRCRGDKCRLTWCESCQGEEDASASIVKINAEFKVIRVALEALRKAGVM